MTVAVIGLGIMGAAIARNLVAAGFVVVGYDTDAARLAALAPLGVTACHSVAAAAAGARVLLTSLPGDAALDATVDAVLQAGIAHSPDWLELSTLSLDCKQRNHARLAAAGITLLDCPISGTGAQAARRDLAVYASGDAAAWERCAPVIAGFARANHFVGAFGHGTRLKFVANLLVAVHNVASAEALGLAVRAGLDPAQACELLGTGAAASKILELRGPMMARDVFEPATMKLDVWQKDLALIDAFARDCDAPTPLFSATLPLYAAAVKAGLGPQDTAAVFRIMQEMDHDAAT
jgi:3-hydroxyisobutyrate dehydrogenase-like beta-hydroxyacid dehydrogenase